MTNPKNSDVPVEWFGTSSAVAGMWRMSSHVGGLTACINWGLTSAAPHSVHVYAEPGSPAWTFFAGRDECRVIEDRGMDRSGLVTALCDGRLISASGPARAAAEALADEDGVDEEIAEEIVLSARLQGISDGDIMAHASGLGEAAGQRVAALLWRVK